MVNSIEKINVGSSPLVSESPRHSELSQKTNTVVASALEDLTSTPQPTTPSVVPEVTPSDFEAKVAQAQQNLKVLTKESDDLSRKIKELGGNPMGGIRRGGVRVINAPEPLRSLQMQIDNLHKDISRKRQLIRSLEAR